MSFHDFVNAEFDKFKSQYLYGGWKPNTPHWQKPETYKAKQLTDKYFKQVLKRSDIYLFLKSLPNQTEQIFITADGYESILVPDNILNNYYSILNDYNKGKRSLWPKLSAEHYIIDECIRTGVFYAPVEHSEFLI